MAEPDLGLPDLYPFEASGSDYAFDDNMLGPKNLPLFSSFLSPDTISEAQHISCSNGQYASK